MASKEKDQARSAGNTPSPEERKYEEKVNDVDKEQNIRERIGSSLAESVKARETKQKQETDLEHGFMPYLEQGKNLTKASLIIRLERELEDVEKQLAGIAEIRAENNWDPNRNRSGKRPSTASRTRPRSHSKKSKRPQSASASSTRMRTSKTRSAPQTSKQRSAKKGLRQSVSSSNVRNMGGIRPHTAERGRSRPSTAGRSRPSTAGRTPSMVSSAQSSASRRSRSRPQSSPLVRLGAVPKKPSRVTAIAGYRPPDLVYDEELLAKARQLNMKDLQRMAETKLFKQACQKSGCEVSAVVPKAVSSFINVKIGFQRLHLNQEEAQERWVISEERRLKLLASVLTERQNILDEMKAKAWATDPGNPNARPQGQNLMGIASQALVSEQKRKQQVKMAQLRNHNLLLKENEALEQRRKDYAKRKEKRRCLEQALLEKTGKAEQLKMEKARRKEKALKDALVQREEAEEDRRRKDERRQAIKSKRAERKKKSMAVANKEKEKIELARKAHREKVKKERVAAKEEKEREIRIRMLEKEKFMKKQNAKRRQEREEKKKEALFKASEKRENLKRIRQQQNYHRIRLREHLKIADQKRKKLTALNRAVVAERAKDRKSALINSHTLKGSTPIERNIMPGPGAYTLPSTIGGKGKGFKVSDANPLGYIDLVVNRAKQVPGPNAYGFADYPKRMKAVKFSDANVPSDVEWIMRRSREQPGPDEYQNTMKFKSDTPAFSMGNFKPKSDVDWIMARSAMVPGPADYYEGLPERRSPLKKVARELGVDV